MKKLLISVLLVLALTASAMLVACDGGDYDDSEDRQSVETHGDEEGNGGESDSTEKETNSSLGIVEDTDEGWGEIQQ